MNLLNYRKFVAFDSVVSSKMFRLVTCALFIGAVVAQEMFDKKKDVLTAICRAQCLNKFYVPEVNTNCLDDSECWMCWDTCQMFYYNYRIWGPMCGEERLCFPGCQESCNFHRLHEELTEVKPGDSGVAQPLRHDYLPKKDAVRFEWSRPKGDHQIGQLVYVLLIEDELSGGWQQLKQTFYHNATVRRGLLKSSSHIRLISYDSEGRTAEIEKASAELDFNSDSENVDEMIKDQRYFDDVVPPYINHFGNSSLNNQKRWLPTLQSLRYSNKHSGGIDAVVSWEHMSHKAQVKYVVEWKQADQTVDLIGQLTTNNNVGIFTLWPSTVYQLTIRAVTSGSTRPIAQSGTLIIDTSARTYDSWIASKYATVLGVATILIIAALVLVTITKCYLYSHTPEMKAGTEIKSARSTERPPSFRHASVKKQLSSLGARITQSPLSPSTKHDRLIEEEPSFSFDHHRAAINPYSV